MAFNITFNQSIAEPISWEPSIILANIYPLAILTIGIFIYAFLIFKFYKYLARRDIVKLKLDIKKPMAWKIFMYLLNQLVIVPVLIFFWFIIMACVLLFLSNSTAGYIMLVSMGTIAAIRITSYYNVLLAEDLAKLLPLTLFAVFILSMDFASLAGKIDTIKQMFAYIDRWFFYLMFAVLVELIMRIQQIIQDVLVITHHNQQLVTSSSKEEKKSYDTIINQTFNQPILSVKDSDLNEELPKIKKRDKKYDDELSL